MSTLRLAAALAAAVLSLGSLTAVTADAAPRVVASVLPVQSLVAAVTEGVTEPALLVDGARSPHDYALKPSDARRLQQAEVVFRIGAGLEAFLDRALVSLAGDARVVDLADAPGVHLHGDAAHATEHAAADGDAHDHHGVDPHVWLSPANAKAMLDAIRDTLVAADPANAERYAGNAARAKARVATADADWRARLATVRDRPFIVFHDAYGALVEHYGLASAGAVTVSPQHAPAAGRVAELRQRLRDSGAVCVFREPQFRAALVDMLAEGTGARIDVLDPLGAGLPPGPDAWFALMENNVAALVRCLGTAGR